LDQWIDSQNLEAHRDGFRPIPKCEFRVVGQLALMEANLNLPIAATQDFDAFHNAHHLVMTKLNHLLSVNGLIFDMLSTEIWMPDEVQYVDVYAGKWVSVVRARPEYIMLSKAKMALEKNRVLLRQYISSRPPVIFFDLCLKYNVNLDHILTKD
ncbi:MAG: hypothetical protein NT027_20515, partial [Proteobacteria bacterium]|nr:hypothetical protein [Pseudomonadota bacterium]